MEILGANVNPHISNNLTEEEANLFIGAVSTKGTEAIGILWYHYWFDYKSNPSNTIAPHLFEKIAKAMEANGARLYSFSKKKN